MDHWCRATQASWRGCGRLNPKVRSKRSRMLVTSRATPLHVCRKSQAWASRLVRCSGADWVPYLAGGAEQGGCSDVISPARNAPLQEGDVLMLDTGLVWDGYFCDFDRNYSVGIPDTQTTIAHARLIEAVDAAVDIAREGAKASDLFHAMDGIVTGGKGGSDAGRLGHGLGMQLTEGLSLTPQDHSVLEAGMVITLEPGIETGDGRMIVHEEDILITAGAPRFLSPRAGRDMVQL